MNKIEKLKLFPFTYYFCERCGHEWKNKSDFVQKCSQCHSDNIYFSELTDTQSEHIKEE
jgi:Zn finger protein HypA/HybF involved in hydrogenase expression